MAKLSKIASVIQSGETVYDTISRIGAMHGAARYMPASVLRDARPATPRNIMAAAEKLVGYGGTLIRQTILGGDVGCDAATAASVAAVIQHAR